MRGIRVLTKEARGAPGPFAACGHGEAAKHTPAPPPSSARRWTAGPQNCAKSAFVPQAVQPAVCLLEQWIDGLRRHPSGHLTLTVNCLRSLSVLS